MGVIMDGFAIYGSPIGLIYVGYSKGAVISLKRVDKLTEGGIKNNLTEEVYRQLTEYFNRKRRVFDFPYKLNGTVFQMKVWKALCKIPYGETRTYKEIAEAVGNPAACRAVGMANNKNPVSIAVPCHRVIGSDGSLTGYGGGLDMKAALLNLEAGKENQVTGIWISKGGNHVSG